MDNNKIGKFIMQRRKYKGLTQKELGDRLFVTDKTVSKWERGLSLPDITILEKLAKELDTDIYSILQISKTDKGLAEDVLEKERLKIKKQFRKKFMIVLIVFIFILFIFLFKTVSFGYDVQHVKYSHYDDKLIDLGVPKFSFYRQISDENYSYKSLRGKEVLKNEIKDYLNTLEFMTCNDTVYYYDESADITIIDYSVRSNLLYSTISYSVKNGNYCDIFRVKEYGKKLDGLNGIKRMDTDDIYIEISSLYSSSGKFVAYLIVNDKKNDKILENSSGTFEIVDDEFIYFRERFYEEDEETKIPNKSIFKIKVGDLILEDNYLFDYVDKVTLK